MPGSVLARPRPRPRTVLAALAAPLLLTVLPAVPAHAATDVFTAASVTRTASGYHVSWAASAPVDVAATTDPSGGGTSTPVGSGGAAGSVDVAGLPAAPRWYFKLTPAAGSPLVVADRSLHLPNARNFRDAGGYRTADGHWIRMGVVYRTNKLSARPCSTARPGRTGRAGARRSC
ncbi:tyrosine-protein phosphatase [Actinomadura atramentaria]|uniref:tyrosine-protein phosphatase n=1 Tax=Actinomadura atramentaria TaxID=1990 RepID=UPI00037275C5|nr:tyrosine-protein phosphatase [Actinomadura atramentaria]